MRARRAQTPLVPRPVFSEVRWAEPPSLRRESADAEPRRARYRLAIRDAVPTRQTVIKLLRTCQAASSLQRRIFFFTD